jgi:SAM-dependent methyltransferase
MKFLISDMFLASTRPENEAKLRSVQLRMREYYAGSPYPAYVHTMLWEAEANPVRDKICQCIPVCSRILEVGNGDGSSIQTLMAHTKCSCYFGCDLSLDRWLGKLHPRGTNFSIASADKLPFFRGSFDIVLSIFVIEHLVFPAYFLDEAWSALRPGGRLLLIAPDFTVNSMASERIGFSYGSGRDKLKRLRLLDALLTAYDSHIRIPRLRAQQRRFVQQGETPFFILTHPNCLAAPGFVPDCDAVYPACPEEIVNYLSRHRDYGFHKMFYRDRYTFGLLVSKQL